jgi:hypothetical protein
MARTVTDIKKEITDNFIGNEIVKNSYGLQEGLTFEEQFSDASLESIIFYCIAFSVWGLEKLFDQHIIEVSTMIAGQKKGSLKWYRNMALAFQYGFNLYPDKDEFNNEGHTKEEIQASKIVKYSAVTEATNQSRLIIKIAGETNGELSPITEAQKEAFIFYMEEIRYAGVPITIINYLPDLLYLNITIKRNPLVLDAQGYAIAPLNGNLRPVDKAISEFLHNLPFNGEFSVDKLETYISNILGVQDISIDGASSAWIDPDSNDYGQMQSIYMSKIPESGYFTTQDKQGNNLIAINYVV